MRTLDGALVEQFLLHIEDELEALQFRAKTVGRLGKEC